MVLIIGGAGFIGSRLKSYFASLNLPFKYTSSKKEDDPSNNYFQLDITQLKELDKSHLRDIFKGVDTIIYLPSLNVQESLVNKALAKKIKIEGAKFCLEQSIIYGATRFINLSTCHVYGSSLDGDYDEDSTLNPSSYYAENHAIAESELVELSKNESIQLNSLRLSNGVGCPINRNADCWMLLVNDLCRKVVTTGQIHLNSPPNVLRDFIPFSLVEEVIFSLAHGDIDLGEEIMNITSAKSIEIKEIAEIIKINSEKTLGRHSKVYFQSAPDISQNRFRISNQLLKEKFINLDFCLDKEINNLLKKCNEWFS
ncbi:SDR family oxidoreductase [Gammaproteobacteria bacterium]|nr:SDR family oxidoreductase [Gammaproteobacteria bacterium]